MTQFAFIFNVLREKSRVPNEGIPEDLMFIIGVCKRLFADGPAEDDPYKRYLAERFWPHKPTPHVEHNPYRALLQLPIERFVTTNYDHEIEKALCASGRVRWEAFSIPDRNGKIAPGGSRLSFTQRSENCDQLALFALAGVGAHISEAKNMVFHCHGRIDEPDTVIATELDYQRWYFAEEAEAAPAFVQTFDLLFTSNPILFVGFGLSDEDLLRPLRRISALTPERRQSRLLFALVPERSEGVDWDRHEQIFERYGLNVIPFVAPPTNDSACWGRVLSLELARLESERLAWQDEWLRKPMFRKVSVRTKPPQVYRHYCISAESHEVLGKHGVRRQLQEIKDKIYAGARVIGIVGPGGTGKSWHVMRLLEELSVESNAFDGFFFWSSYYADDSLTGLDRLLEYVDPGGNREESRLARLRQILGEKRFLIVLDGVERLLRATEDPGTGRTNEPATRKILEIFLDHNTKATLVLTSRLWPRELDPKAPEIEKYTLARLRTDDLMDVEPFSWLDRATLSELCSLLDGHAYALVLAGRLIGRGTRPEVEGRYLNLRRALVSAHPDRRLGTVIDLALDALGQATAELARPLLERLAVFMSPVTEQTVRLCCGLSTREAARLGLAVPEEEEVVSELLRGGVLFRVTAGPTEEDPPAFTVHPTVRTYLFEQADEVRKELLPNFTLAGFTSSRAAVHPGSPVAAAMIEELFGELYRQAVTERAAGRSVVANELCRSAFGIVRSRMEANTVSRWTTYGAYIRFGLRLAKLAKALSPGCWSFREWYDLPLIEDPGAPLYADEVAFVYNDIGLTLCSVGAMEETLAIWREGYEINKIIEGVAEVPFYSLQSQLHLGHTYLELGSLAAAEEYLEAATGTNRSVKDDDYEGRILGYRALISYYRGQFDEADSRFASALRKLKGAGGNPRAQSFFLNHRSKLAMTRGYFDRAEMYLGASKALAAGIHADDLLAYCRTVRGRLLCEQENFVEANSELHVALIDARRLGIRRLESEIMGGLCRVALRLGDTALARRRAMAGLGLANELRLGLRQTLCLFLLGVATVRAGQPALGAAYLRLAKKLGDAQQYWLRSAEVERYLRELGREVER